MDKKKDKINEKFKKYITVELYVGSNVKYYKDNGNMFTKYSSKLFNPLNDESDTRYSTANLFIDSDNNVICQDPLSGETDIVMDDTIVEFGFDKSKPEGFNWVPIRVRYLKTTRYKNDNKEFGNDEKVANDIFMSYSVPVVEDIIISGKIPDELIEKSKKFEQKMDKPDKYYSPNTNSKNYVRSKYQNFHNLYVKDELYKNAKKLLNKDDIELIEFASGRGGDIPRWKKYGFKKVTAIEYYMVSIEEAKDRFKKVQRPKPYTVFLRGDLSKLIFPNYEAGQTESNKINLKKFLPLQNAFDLLSVQFAIHYFFQNEITVRTIMQNINDNLKVGGLVIGTCFDGEKIFNSLKGKSKLKGIDKNGDLLWSIEKKYNIRKLAVTKNSLGREINVFVKSIGTEQLEYLVNFNYMDSLFEEYGFKKIKVESFSDIYDRHDFELEDYEKDFSFMYNSFVYQKVNNTPSNVYTKLTKLMKKQESKKN